MLFIFLEMQCTIGMVKEIGEFIEHKVYSCRALPQPFFLKKKKTKYGKELEILHREDVCGFALAAKQMGDLNQHFNTFLLQRLCGGHITIRLTFTIWR